MSSEGNLKLQELSTNLQDFETVWSTISPAKAALIAAQYERRADLWKRKIALQSTILMLVQAVASEGEVLGDNAAQQAALEESLDVANDNAEEIVNDAQVVADLDNTKNLIEEVPDLWREIERVRTALREEIDAIVASQLENFENKPGDDWAEVCEEMRLQRERLEKDIQASRLRLAELEERGAKPTLEVLHNEMNNLRELKKGIAQVQKTKAHTEALLEEYHGIVAYSDDVIATENDSDLREYLLEEQDTMIEYYEAKIKRNARIVNVTSAKSQNGEVIDVTVTPMSDWLEFWRRNRPDHPGLKYVTVSYNRSSPHPVNIAIKINTSTVAESNFDAVVGPLVQRIQEWKQKMMNSATVDIHGLIRLFL